MITKGEQKETTYAIIIDTDQYAGNFEREATAYATGCVGECEVGKNMADDFHTDYPDMQFSEKINQIVDDHACHRPVEIVTNDEGIYNSFAIHFDEKPTVEELKFISERVKEYFKLYWNKKVKVNFLRSKIIQIDKTTTVTDLSVYFPVKNI